MGSKQKAVIDIPVKVSVSVDLNSEDLKPLRDAIDMGISFSLVLEIVGGRNQFIVYPDEYVGQIKSTLNSESGKFDFDCVVTRSVDRWMTKYKNESPFDCVLEGVYDTNGDLYRFGEDDKDGLSWGVPLGKVAI